MTKQDYIDLHRRYQLLLDKSNSKEKKVPEDARNILRQKFQRMMAAVYSQQGATLKIEFLQNKDVSDFVDTHTDILNSSMQQEDLSDVMRSRLEQSNYVFSGMKTFHELNEAFPSILDEKGNRKPFNRFLNDVQSIDDTYNKNYLRSEYNFVAASSSMAGRWENFSQDADDYNLQYRTAGDSHVRPEHAELNGITLPFSDPFWDENFPPNGWNCRCTVVQVLKDKSTITPHEEANSRAEKALANDKTRMFRFNSGKQQRSVPAYNPYTIRKCQSCPIGAGNKSKLAKADIPDNQLCAACKLFNECAGNKEKSKQAIEKKHYLHEMESLLPVKVQNNIGKKPVNIGFTKYGNKHLYSDTFIRTSAIKKEDLKNIDKLLQKAKYMGSSPLTHPRKDNIVEFHYYKTGVNGKQVRFNVAEKQTKRSKGMLVRDYFLYSINGIKKESNKM